MFAVAWAGIDFEMKLCPLQFFVVIIVLLTIELAFSVLIPGDMKADAIPF